MKTFLKILAGLAALVVLALAAVFHFTAGMADAADGFFRATRDRDLATAQSYLSEGFRAATPEAALQEFLATSALDGYADATWSRREVSGGTGELEGTVTTASGGSIPVKLVMVKEGDAWKIHGITKTPGGVQTAGDPVASTPVAIAEPARALPDAAAQAALLQQTVRDFGESIAARDMSHFRSTTTPLWQEQMTVEQFEAAYGSIYDAGFDFIAAAALEPEIEPARAAGEHGEIEVNGRFPTQPKLVVQAKYVPGEGGWKPYALKVDSE